MANIAELRNKIFAATGHKISDDDPVFAVAVLNEIVVGDLLKEQARSLVDQVDRIEAAAAYVSTTAQETVDAYTRASVASKRELDAQAKAAAANAQAAINTAVAGLVPSVKEAVGDAARAKINEIQFTENMRSIWSTGFLFGMFFLAGWVGGAMILAKTQAGLLTWGEFWSVTQWGIGIGLVAPIMSLFGLGLTNAMPKTGWTLFGAGALAVLFLFVKIFTS